MSKFDYEYFADGCKTVLGFNAEKYTKEKALEISVNELGVGKEELCVDEAYVYYGFGCDWEGEKRNCYWISDCPNAKSMKVWRVKENEQMDTRSEGE